MTKVRDETSGRWSEYIDRVIGDFEFVAGEFEDDYQGSCAVVGWTPGDYSWNPGAYALAEWSYGSCSGCDGYEDMSEVDRIKSFFNMVEFMDESTMEKYARNVVDKEPRFYFSRHAMFEKVIAHIESKRAERED